MSANKRVDSGLNLFELALDEAGLSVSCTEEGSVNCNQNPRSLAEGNGGEQEAAPKEDFENSDEPHRCVIVFFDELANQIGSGVSLVSWLSAWRSRLCSNLRRLEGWNQVRASVGCDMEDRVNTEWEHCERVLRGEEPNEGHTWIFVSRCLQPSR